MSLMILYWNKVQWSSEVWSARYRATVLKMSSCKWPGASLPMVLIGAPLGRSHCPGQEASSAHRYRITRLYMHLLIDGSEGG
ncbi:unnamed protein product [Tetraodon nigroviridis]|uniref:(spotted green pufferfish) hypothetical protein n=1 Tax=Tetraodon nigroviridis TaxID=99883 RepID=Q4RZE2_TETNG|nr:unnamed protein product [Tetraodon nigroviridis]